MCKFINVINLIWVHWIININLHVTIVNGKYVYVQALSTHDVCSVCWCVIDVTGSRFLHVFAVQ